jgi:hypothetical protein
MTLISGRDDELRREALRLAADPGDRAEALAVLRELAALAGSDDITVTSD